MSRAHHQVIYLKQAAPSKPPVGSPCNGCGVCCAAETCPLARVLLLQWRGPCRALRWQEDRQRYACGMLLAPGRELPLLPSFLEAPMQRLVHRWIAAGAGCDSTAEPGRAIDDV